MFAHVFTSSTAGRLQWLFNEDSAANSAYITKSFSTSATGTSGFNSGGGVALINSGDYIICEFPYKIIGVDSFNNTAPTVTTSTNMTTEYQIDTGSGYGGTWKTFNASNLSGETVDEVAGFYFKLKITANATAAANLVTRVSCITDSNAAAQALQYTLDPVTVKITVKDINTGSPIQNARVFLETDPGGVDIFNALTDANGVVQNTVYAYTATQAVVGKVRKASAAPYYKTAPIVDSITSSGLDATIFLIPDA
jgi:hypothetical protein